MSLKLVVIVVAAVLALAQGVPLLRGHMSQMLFQSCNPHLRLPNGSRMEVDLVNYYNEVDPKCLGGLVMAAFNIQRRFKLFETKEDTAICHGFIELLSLIDAYNWTQEMCEQKALADERGLFCKTYNDRLKDIELLTLKYNATGYDHLTVIGLLLSRVGEENCPGICGGMMNSTLCRSFVDASKFFLAKFESDQPPEKIIIPEENSTQSSPLRSGSQPPRPPEKNIPLTFPTKPVRPTTDGASNDKDAKKQLLLLMKEAFKEMQLEKAGSSSESKDKPPAILPSPGQPPNVDTASKETAIAAVPTSEAINTTASITPESETTVPTPSESSTTEDTSPLSEEPTTMKITASPSSSSIDELTEKKDEDETLPIEPQQPPDDSSISDGLVDVLDQFEMTKEDLLRVLGPDFHGDVNRMDYEEIMDALDEAAEFEEKDVDITGEEDEILEPLGTAKSDIPEEKPQAPKIESPKQEVNKIVKLGTTKVDELEEEVEEEVKSGSYGSWHFFTIILVLAVVVIGGYLCVHNRKKLREGVGSYLSDSKHRRKRTREYKPLMGQT